MKSKLLSSVFVLAATAAMSTVTAHAQEAETTAPTAAPASGFDDIVVTARKVEENIQEVPVAITAFSGAQMEERNVTNLIDIGKFTPGFQITQAANGPQTLSIQSRGQVQGDTLATLEPSIGVYVDQMYWARPKGLNTSMLDLSNAQVLRGPQGTLFGRNTTGGALLLTSNDPNTEEATASANFTYGSYNERASEFVLNMPLADNLALRGALRVRDRDGWAYGVRSYNVSGNPDNSQNGVIIRPDGREFNDRHEVQGRLKALWEINDDMRLILSGEWYSFESNGDGRQMLYKAPLNIAAPSGAQDQVAFNTSVLAYQQYMALNPDAVGVDAFQCSFAVTPSNCTLATLGGETGPYQQLDTETYNLRYLADT
ncbi:MAG: TonB-dependent receptor plug domain-containing protein, partial [Caulobacterales bacterium]